MRKLHARLLSLSALFLLVVNYSCHEKDLNPDNINSSFGLIQAKIFNTSCAISGCHFSTKDASFAQHKLVLKQGVAYENLVNIESENAKARADGLIRVKPGDSENSLLHHKLHCDNGHHSQDYGIRMPLGLDPLSKGQIEYIAAWINEGAPKEGLIQADRALLDDNVSDCEENFMHLVVPSQSEGYQIKIDAFDVASQFEREIFIYKEVGNQEEFYLKKVEMKMRRNSHHFLVSTFIKDTPSAFLPQVNSVRDLRDLNGKLIPLTVSQMEYQVFTIASQTPELEYTFPPGVALKIPAQHKLDVNLHYVNKGMSPIIGECSMNLYKVSHEEVEHTAHPIFFSHIRFSLLPKQKTIIIHEFDVEVEMKIFMLTSHTHKLAERFEIQIKGGNRNGEMIYASSDWHHPVIKTYDTPIDMKPGDGLRMIITYNNTTDKIVNVGHTSEDEMAIIYGYYY